MLRVSSIGWRPVRAGSGKGAVFCLNFTVGGVRAQATFADLASELPDGYAVWATSENAWPTTPTGPGTQLASWLADSCTVDAPVRAVLGTCGTAAVAAALAGRLAGAQAPALVLFDPIVVGPQQMIAQTEESLRQLAGPTAVASDLGEDLPVGDLGDQQLSDEELGELATTLAKRYAERATVVGAAKSIRPATVADLCTRLEAYLRYLALGTSAWSHPRAVPDLLVVSRDHEVPAELSDAPLVRLDASQHRLLAHPQAARATAQVLAGALVHGRS